MNRIAVIGSGYVGLVTGACLASFGINVTCVDNDTEKINKLQAGEIPIYEPGLSSLIKSDMDSSLLSFTSDIENAVQKNNIIFIAVGTPEDDDGRASLKFVLEVADSIAMNMNCDKIVVVKSTVPVGTCKTVKRNIEQCLQNKGLTYNCKIVSNPEFLREGTAVNDFINPNRIVLGVEDNSVVTRMKELYKTLISKGVPYIVTNIETSELIKYASNAFLATKISFINELSELSERVGADIKTIAKGIGLDPRIGAQYLDVGPGYGGSCLPKDTMTLSKIAENFDCDLKIINATIQVNKYHINRIIRLMISNMNGVKGKIIGVWGIAFKNNTDDIRYSPALTIIKELLKNGAIINIYDPKSIVNVKKQLREKKDSINYCSDKYQAAQSAHAIILTTEWDEFLNIDFLKLKNIMRNDYFFDLRDICCKELMLENGFDYYSIGR